VLKYGGRLMARRSSLHPTESELAILSVLWRRGPSTVREVHEALGGDKRTGYTTSLKLMQIMTGKGLVTRDESSRTHVYKAKKAKHSTQQQLVRSLVDRVFEGSSKSLIMQALSAKKSTPEDLAEIRELLDTMEGGGQ
jgi:predicted transcriptional regulator